MKERLERELRENAEWDARQLSSIGINPTTLLPDEAARIDRSQAAAPLPQILLVAIAATRGQNALSEILAQASDRLPLVSRARAVFLEGSGPSRIEGESAPWTWWPMNEFRLMGLGPLFTNQISDLLWRVTGPDRGVARSVRLHLTNILYQPLDNCRLHGSGTPDWDLPVSFSGMSVRLIRGVELIGSSELAYLESIGENAESIFAEFIVHDTGPGIALHFARNRDAADANLYSLPPSREWIQLTQAFEKHMTGRPEYMRRRINQNAFAPGIGLFAVLSGLHALNGFLEVRCGRLRAYRWLQRSIEFRPDEALLHPVAPPESPVTIVAGTILRFLIPLPASTS